MYTLVRKTLEIYLREKRVLSITDFPPESSTDMKSKDAIFVTLYYQWRVVGSSGRIICKKENTVYECIDNTLLCLKDARLTLELQDIAKLSELHIRTDRIATENRRILRDISELDTTREGLIFLSQNLGVMSVILPHMVHGDTSPEIYLALATKKAWVDLTKIMPSDYVLYGLTTMSESDFGI